MRPKRVQLCKLVHVQPLLAECLRLQIAVTVAPGRELELEQEQEQQELELELQQRRDSRPQVQHTST